MAYTINKFNGEPLVQLQDGSVDVSTSLQLVGRSYVGYGEIQNENFVFLMENFANNNPPSRPIKGQTWFNSQENLLNIYDGEKWSVLGSAQLSDNPPENPSLGYLWLKTPENVLHIWDGSNWAFIGPEKVQGFGDTRARSQSLKDTDNVDNPVILLTVNGVVVAICSSRAFTINSSNAILGFTNLVPGLNLSSTVSLRGDLIGVADRATRLENIRTINGIGFNGTQNITITAATPTSLIAGDHLVGFNFDGSQQRTWRVDASSENTPGKVVVRNSQGGFSAGLITANLVGNVLGNVTATSGTSKFSTIEADRIIGATVSGNSDTATRLRTARQINGVLFDGTQNITVAASAETLTGSALRNTITFSNLSTVGTLQSLSVLNPGITLGNASQLKISIEGNTPTIQSQSTLNMICDAGGPDISFIGPVTALQQGAPQQATIVGNNLINIGTPAKKFDQIFANNFRGIADSATLSTLSNSLTGGGIGSIPYQTSTDQTAMLPIGSAGQALVVGPSNTIIWRSFQSLTPGSYIIGDSFNTLSSQSWSIDATSENSSNKIVARDSQGNFSAGSITASLIGNSSTATRLLNARTINGVSFDGTANINIAAFTSSNVTFGNTVFSIAGFTNQVNAFNNNANYFDVFPPAGKTMSNLLAFIPSIAVIHFAGNVNGDDSMRCTWSNLGDRIRVWVQNTEQRSTPAANFLAIWS